MDALSWTLIAGGTASALWWGRGCASWARMIMAGLLAAAVVAVPYVAGAVVRGTGGQEPDSWLLGALGVLSLVSSYGVFRRAGSTSRFGTRPVIEEVLGEIERAREVIGGPRVEGIAGPPIGLFLLAGAGGLANPFVLVTNGVVHCLEPDERRAILGHEVAHHATGSLWWLVGLPALAPGVAVLVMPSAYPGGLLALALLLRLVFRCAASRPIEYLCDALGARVETREVMAQALSRVSALNPLDHSSRASRILHSFWTHPATDRRIARLSRPARPGQLLRDLIPSAVAVIVAVVGAVVVARLFPSFLVVAAVVTYLGLGLLVRLAMRPNTWKALQKAPAPGRRLFVIWVVASLGSLVGIIIGAGLDLLVLFLVAFGALLLSLLLLPVIYVLRLRAPRRHRAAMLQLADAPAALVENRAVKAKTYLADPVLLHAAAMAKARTGDRVGADEDYATLLRRWPSFLMPRATWAEEIYREEPARAIELLSKIPPGNATVARLQVESWLRLGDIDRAKESLRPALAKTPLAPEVLAGRASIALAEGEIPEAHEILEEAGRQGAFGNPTLIILSSRVAMALGELEIAEKGLDKAEAILDGMAAEGSVLRPDLLAGRAELERCRERLGGA